MAGKPKYEIVDVEQAAISVRQLADRKARLERVNELLSGQVEVGTRSDPWPPGIALLHRRALLVTALAKDSVWG